MMRLLIVDDSKSSLLALKLTIEEFSGCEVEAFTHPELAVRRSAEIDFDLVVLDYMMPEMNGIEVIRKLRKQQHYENVPIIMITSQVERAVRIEALEVGATDFLTKPLDPFELSARISNLLTLRKAQIALAERAELLDVARQLAALQAETREKETIWCLAQAMAVRDGNTGDHVERVANVAELIAMGLGLDTVTRQNIYLAAPLHDIGKIGISDAILRQPGRLDAIETAQMRLHVPIGVDILRKSSTKLARVATAIIKGHHEKWDGSGYPDGVAGETIPIEARIVAVADVFDALCSDRPYKSAWPVERAYNEILSCSGSHFDPACVDSFRLKWPEIKALMEPRFVACSPGTRNESQTLAEE